MKLTLENTDKIVTMVVNGHDVPARVWQGKTESGIEVHCYITRIAVAEGRPETDYLTFKQELAETAKMRPEIAAIPLRMIL